MIPETLQLDTLQPKQFSPLVLSPITPVYKLTTSVNFAETPKSHVARGGVEYNESKFNMLAFVEIHFYYRFISLPQAIEPLLGDVATPRSNQLASDPRATIHATHLASSQRS